MTERHRAALEYDWRARFGLPFSEVGRSMDYGEAIRLVGLLSADPSTQLAAALNKWDAPRSAEWLTLADLYDAFGQAHWKRTKPYPRPYPDEGTKRRGRTKKARREVIALLNRFGHSFDDEKSG